MSDASRRFHDSTRFDHEQWHDGVGYDLDAFSAMTQQERDAAAAEARNLGDPDWRDLEVLAAHGSRESIERLRHLLTHQSIDTRAHALRILIDAGHTPGSVADVHLAHVLDAVTENDGLTAALLIAEEHAGPMSKLALLRGAKDRPDVALHFASALLDLAEASDDLAAFDPRFRPLLLRLLPDNAEADRAAAFEEVCRILEIDPASIPATGSGTERAWAEEMWADADARD